MPNSNYSKGYNFEAQFVKSLREDESFVMADRFHKSVGPMWKPDHDRLNRFGNYMDKHAPIDVWAIDHTGRMHMYQNKAKTMISTSEMLDLIEFAWEFKETITVGLVTKPKGRGKKTKVWILNNKTY